MKFVIPFATEKSTYQCIIDAENEKDALQKIEMIELWLSRKSISLQPYDTTYLLFCMGKLENPPDEFIHVGKVFSYTGAKELIDELEEKNRLLINLNKSPIKTLAKGMFFAPFRAPVEAVRGFISVIKDVAIALKNGASYGRSVWEQSTTQNKSITIEGQEYILEEMPLSSPPKIGIGTLIAFLSALLALILILHPAIPSIFKVTMSIMALGLFSYVARVIVANMRGK